MNQKYCESLRGSLKKTARGKVVTRQAVIRAFTTPGRKRRDVMEQVSRYMSDSTVPPQWTYVSVKEVFGRVMARAWARHIRGLQPASEKQGTRTVFPVVQTIWDFGYTRAQVEELASRAIQV